MSLTLVDMSGLETQEAAPSQNGRADKTLWQRAKEFVGLGQDTVRLKITVNAGLAELDYPKDREVHQVAVDKLLMLARTQRNAKVRATPGLYETMRLELHVEGGESNMKALAEQVAKTRHGAHRLFTVISEKKVPIGKNEERVERYSH